MRIQRQGMRRWGRADGAHNNTNDTASACHAHPAAGTSGTCPAPCQQCHRPSCRSCDRPRGCSLCHARLAKRLLSCGPHPSCGRRFRACRGYPSSKLCRCAHCLPRCIGCRDRWLGRAGGTDCAACLHDSSDGRANAVPAAASRATAGTSVVEASRHSGRHQGGAYRPIQKANLSS